MNFKIAFSSCPNDTLIFYAMTHKKIDTANHNFSYELHDIEKLNSYAFKGAFDIIKLSYKAYAYCSDKYQILNAGSALGYKNGPKIISKRKIYPDEIKFLKIAIPGEYTTANLLLDIFFPDTLNKHNYLFSNIEDVILSNEVDAGLIIHENRFTFRKKGLNEIADLGELWEQHYKLPIPLGGIVVKRELNDETKREINKILFNSIKYGLENKQDAGEFLLKHAQIPDTEIVEKHIDLYVNQFSLDLGEKGRSAISKLFDVAAEKNAIPKQKNKLFID